MNIPKSESQLLDEIENLVADCEADWLVKGVGDDAAVTKLGKNQVFSVDAQVDGVHFRFGWGTPFELGRRSVLAAMSDLNAMGAASFGVLVSLSTRPDQTHKILPWLRGAKDAAELAGGQLIGGNLARANQWQAHTTVIGVAETEIRRAGAQANHGVFVTGTLGGAKVVLENLLAGRDVADKEAWLFPTPPFQHVSALRETASAAIDISDGLGVDTKRLLQASGVGGFLEIEKIPTAPAFHAAIKKGIQKPLDILYAAEDYQIVLTSPLESLPFATRIGTVVQGHDLTMMYGGQRIVRTTKGHDHFDPSAEQFK